MESQQKKVKEFGNGAHVVLPKSWLGEEVTVSIGTDSKS